MLEIKKLELEKMKVFCGKQEMLYKIAEREEDIERLKENISAQEQRILELDEKLKQLKQG